MKFRVYVVKCESEKYWVGFTSRELDVYLMRMIEGKGPLFTREHKPLDIFLMCETDSVEKAELENVNIYIILSKVLGSQNVQMDTKRYNRVTNSIPENAKTSEFGNEIALSFSPTPISENKLKVDESERFIVYSLLCNKNARYIGLTTNLQETFQAHKSGKMGEFTKAYKPKQIEFKVYYDTEINAKMGQIELLDLIRKEEGTYIKIYTEFINSKPDLRVVWEDIIPPAKEELFENTPNNPEIKYWVYVLGCEDSKYYVGFTSNLRKRFKKHCSGMGGSNFTYEFIPYYVLHIEGHKNLISAKNAETNWTLDLKKIKGKDNVFGFWGKSNEPDNKMYFAHELLEKWVIKNPKAFDIDRYD